MKVTVFSLLLVATTVCALPSAAEQQNKLFKCISGQDMQVDSSCVANTIGQSEVFKISQAAFFDNLETTEGAEISSIAHYPHLSLIKITAPRMIEKLETRNALAKN